METMNYSMFKVNDMQPINRKHKSDLEESIISTNGNIVPIIINQDMTILDGHGRFNACMNNKLPLKYEAVVGDIRTMEILNTSSTPWGINQYIAHHAVNDNNYSMLLDLINIGVPIGMLQSFCGLTNKDIKSCVKFDIDFEYIKFMWDKSKELMELTGCKTKNGVHRALSKMVSFDGFDIDFLISQVRKHWHKKYEYGTVDGDNAVFHALSEMYDYNSRYKLNMYYAYKAKGK